MNHPIQQKLVDLLQTCIQHLLGLACSAVDGAERGLRISEESGQVLLFPPSHAPAARAPPYMWEDLLQPWLMCCYVNLMAGRTQSAGARTQNYARSEKNMGLMLGLAKRTS